MSALDPTDDAFLAMPSSMSSPGAVLAPGRGQAEVGGWTPSAVRQQLNTDFSADRLQDAHTKARQVTSNSSRAQERFIFGAAKRDALLQRRQHEQQRRRGTATVHAARPCVLAPACAATQRSSWFPDGRQRVAAAQDAQEHAAMAAPYAAPATPRVRWRSIVMCKASGGKPGPPRPSRPTRPSTDAVGEVRARSLLVACTQHHAATLPWQSPQPRTRRRARR